MDKTLVVKNNEGKDITINVIDIIEDTSTNKQYICYNFEGMEDVFVSNLVETADSFTLETVTEEEKRSIEELLSQESLENNTVNQESVEE